MGAVLSVCRSLRWPCPLRCRYVFGPSERCSLLDVVHVEHRQAAGPRQRGLAQSLFLVPLFPVPCSLIQAMGCRETFARLSRMPSRRRRHLPYVLDLQPRLGDQAPDRSEEHTSELQSLMRISYAVFCLTKKKKEQK